jgi:hypothetical protein
VLPGGPSCSMESPRTTWRTLGYISSTNLSGVTAAPSVFVRGSAFGPAQGRAGAGQEKGSPKNAGCIVCAQQFYCQGRKIYSLSDRFSERRESGANFAMYTLGAGAIPHRMPRQRVAAEVPESAILGAVASYARPSTRVRGRDKGIGIEPLNCARLCDTWNRVGLAVVVLAACVEGCGY